MLAAPLRTRYLQASYWALGMLAGLVSGERPSSEVEGAASIGIFSVGILFFAYAIGNLSSIDEQGSEQAREFYLILDT